MNGLKIGCCTSRNTDKGFAVVGGGGGGGLCLPFKTLNTDLKHSKDIPTMQLAEAVQSQERGCKI